MWSWISWLKFIAEEQAELLIVGFKGIEIDLAAKPPWKYQRRIMAMAGLYRRVLPSPPAIDFASSEGKVLCCFMSLSLFGGQSNHCGDHTVEEEEGIVNYDKFVGIVFHFALSRLRLLITLSGRLL